MIGVGWGRLCCFPPSALFYSLICVREVLKRVGMKEKGFPGGASGKEPACECRRRKRHRFDPWVGRIPWKRAWLPTPVFLPGESPWTEEPGRLQPIGSQKARHD